MCSGFRTLWSGHSVTGTAGHGVTGPRCETATERRRPTGLMHLPQGVLSCARSLTPEGGTMRHLLRVVVVLAVALAFPALGTLRAEKPKPNSPDEPMAKKL